MMKEAFIDTETTGVDPMKHGLFMIGGIIRIDGVIKEEFKFCCDVFAEDEFAEDAMKKHGYTPEDIGKFPDPFNTLLSLVTLLGQYVDKYNKQDKYHFIGYGAEFDNKFLRRWFESVGDQYFGSWFWHPWIDVMSLAAEALKQDRHTMPNFQLETVAKYFKIKIDDDQTHDALYDARLTMQVYDQITGKRSQSENLIEQPDGSYKYRLRK
jgi:DNA polymerase III epsilon subunit-like protein